MGKPRVSLQLPQSGMFVAIVLTCGVQMIILIRHAQSEGNRNRAIHQTIPDHRVKLTDEGHKQAREAGRKLRDLLRPDDTLHFFTSPYRRTRETTEGILESLTSDNPEPSPFPRNKIKVYEEPRLREQDFGNFQPDSEEMQRMWNERAAYGHFFYRIPSGESAADAYDRVSGFNDTLYRLFGEDDFASVCILVTHGLMSRIFLMKWYHFSVEYFEDLRNVNHCEFIVMKRDPEDGRYILQNTLRTWTQLRRDLAAKGEKFPGPKIGTDAPIPIRRKYMGCRDGWTKRKDSITNGSGVPDVDGSTAVIKKLPRRKNTADLFRDNDEPDEDSDDPARPPSQLPGGAKVGTASGTLPRSSLHTITLPQDTILEVQNPLGSSTSSVFSPTELGHRQILLRQAAATPSSTHPPGLSLIELTGGRDGGGSLSGAASLVASSDDDENSKDRSASNRAESKSRRIPQSLARALHGELSSGSKKKQKEKIDLSRPMADALGDQSDASVCEDDLDDDVIEEEDENDGNFVDQEEHHRLMEELEREKREDQSIRGSVY